MDSSAPATTSDTTPVRKPYSKPRLELVRLDPQATVLASCKGTNNFGPPEFSGCLIPGGSCLELGS